MTIGARRISLTMPPPPGGGAATLITETFQGSNTIVNGFNAAQSITGFDNPPGVPPYEGAPYPFNGWWHDSVMNPAITTDYPCPVGSNKSLATIADTANFNFDNIVFLHPGIREFWYRIYMRFGDADSYNDYEVGPPEVTWAKLVRCFSQTWQWGFLIEEHGNLDYMLIEMNQAGGFTFGSQTFDPIWLPCKWFYHEWHIKCETQGQSDGVIEVWARNVSDNLPIVSHTWTGLAMTNGSSETVDIVRIGGNTGTSQVADRLVRYTNFAFGTSGRIGEV